VKPVQQNMTWDEPVVYNWHLS